MRNTQIPPACACSVLAPLAKEGGEGEDVKYAKDILRHFNIKTTERYLHVSKEELVKIISPLDNFWAKGKIKR